LTNQSKTRSEQVVWICRHGNRIDFVDPTWREANGHDPHLSPDGVIQAQETGKRLAGEGIRRIFSSPFLRTAETAHHIAEALDVPICIEQGVSEWLNLDWFAAPPILVPPRELAKRFPRIDSHYKSAVIPHFPETDEQALAREERTVHLLIERYRENLLFVGHGHSVTGLAQALLGAPDDIHCGLCGLIKLVHRDGHWEMELNGDTTHLGGGEKHRQRLF